MTQKSSHTYERYMIYMMICEPWNHAHRPKKNATNKKTMHVCHCSHIIKIMPWHIFMIFFLIWMIFVFILSWISLVCHWYDDDMRAMAYVHDLSRSAHINESWNTYDTNESWRTLHWVMVWMVWIIGMCATTHWYVCHDSFMCERAMLYMECLNHAHVPWLAH